MWQKCSAGQNNDGSCSGTSTYKTWDDAGAYCDSLVLGGYSDWRLPIKKELITIVDYGIPFPGPTINQTYFPNTQSSHYWSSTTNAFSSTDSAWVFTFSGGGFHFVRKTNLRYVRCVRAGQGGSFDNFVLSVTKFGTGAGTVTSSPSGIDCDDSTCSASFTSGTSVTLTATPASGSTFAGWGGACSGTGTCTVTMDAAKSVTATFNAQSSACVYTINPTTATFGSSPGTGVIRVDVLPSGCVGNWTAVSNANWISITSGSSGTVSGSVTYTVSQNTTGATRTETITAANQTHTVTQTTSTREPIYRFYNTYTGGHFFTDNPNERNMVIRDLPDFRWESDGAYYIYRTQQSGTSPVYRLFNTLGVGHYYTASEDDKSSKIVQGYALERVGFYAFTTQVSGTKPVYYFNRPASTNNGKEAWFYTISEAEKDLIITTMPVWVYKGIAFYAYEY